MEAVPTPIAWAMADTIIWIGKTIARAAMARGADALADENRVDHIVERVHHHSDDGGKTHLYKKGENAVPLEIQCLVCRIIHLSCSFSPAQGKSETPRGLFRT